MRLEIFVGGMDHECCGPEIERYQQVRWNYVAGDDGRNYEVHPPGTTPTRTSLR
ncbi:hypothetical protein [Microbacterium kribbense]|uniref:hypothetical protein n=1 Tax=Microbacterium kribbense TaxID=433645 RepID=UPI0031CF07D0